MSQNKQVAIKMDPNGPTDFMPEFNEKVQRLQKLIQNIQSNNIKIKNLMEAHFKSTTSEEEKSILRFYRPQLANLIVNRSEQPTLHRNKIVGGLNGVGYLTIKSKRSRSTGVPHEIKHLAGHVHEMPGCFQRKPDLASPVPKPNLVKNTEISQVPWQYIKRIRHWQYLWRWPKNGPVVPVKTVREQQRTTQKCSQWHPRQIQRQLLYLNTA